MENNRTCENCNVNVHRASMLKHFKSKKRLENEEPIQMNIREWLFREKQAAIETKIKKV